MGGAMAAITATNAVAAGIHAAIVARGGIATATGTATGIATVTAIKTVIGSASRNASVRMNGRVPIDRATKLHRRVSGRASRAGVRRMQPATVMNRAAAKAKARVVAGAGAAGAVAATVRAVRDSRIARSHRVRRPQTRQPTAMANLARRSNTGPRMPRQ